MYFFAYPFSAYKSRRDYIRDLIDETRRLGIKPTLRQLILYMRAVELQTHK